MPSIIQGVLDVLAEGEVVSENGRCTAVIAERLGVNPHSVTTALVKLKSLGCVVAESNAQRTYRLRLGDVPYPHSRGGSGPRNAGNDLGPARAVNAYLSELMRSPGSPGYDSRTVEQLEARIAQLDESVRKASSPVAMVKMIQTRREVERALLAKKDGDAREAFVKIAKEYSERQGIEYATWRDVGVPASVLKEAGVER